jgi:ATP-dependent helicase/nuclease subunit A
LTPDSSFDDLVDALEPIGKETREKLQSWSEGDFKNGESACLKDDADDLAEASGSLLEWFERFKGADPKAFGAARAVLLSLLLEIEAKRAERGIATFADLLVKTARLFEEHDGICRSERRGMDQLLVDEFQDTDDVQCRIVGHLALDGPEDARPGLFVVGDPKQSIYAWRSADLAAYDAFVDEVVAAGGEQHPLTSNFRSVKPILDEVEVLVQPVMDEQHGFQPAFEGLDATDDRIASPGFRQGRWSAVEHWNCRTANEVGDPKAKKQKVDELNAEEARAMAADIRSLHDEAGVAFGDIAVLLRATTAQQFILEAFREVGVPFEVAREREYYRQREIIEAAGLVRAILEPADALALLTVIRSDAVGVPDAALAPLWDAGLPAATAGLGDADPAGLTRVRRVVAEAARRVGAEPGVDRVPTWPHLLTAALERLAELRRSMREDPPDVFVERLRTLWLAEVSAAARYLGRFRQARLDGFYAELETTLSGGRGSTAEVARFLRRSVGESREAPSAPEPDLDTDAVHVMTIYGAKGLDFDHVYLAQIHRGSRGPVVQAPAVLRRVGGVAELKLFGWPTPGFEAAEQIRELKARAERVRLLYVAATRAKERLVVSGGWEEPGSEVPPLEAKTFADLIARRDDRGVFRGLADSRIGRETDSESGVTWVMPALDGEGGSGAGAGRTSFVMASPEDVATDTAAIAEARAEAEARMSMRWSLPASDAAHRNEVRRETDLGGDETVPRPPQRNDFAAAIGTEIHRLLETLDFADDLPKQIEARRSAVVAAACGGLQTVEGRSAAARAETLLDRLVKGDCLSRLAELTPFVAARELEVFLAPTENHGGSVVSGAIDLVYRDPDDGRLVVADYKTDAVEDEAGVAERVERYRPQLETYARALEEALALGEEPHAELWFLHADRIVRLR